MEGEGSVIYTFLDLQVGEEKLGRVIIELDKEKVPKTAENFRALCTGEVGASSGGKKLHYKGTRFHRVVPQFMVQGGDIENNDGTGGFSIYGKTFDDENFDTTHELEGMVGMANKGVSNSNNSQFYITTVPCLHLDGQNVVFGKVVKGLNIIKELSDIPREKDLPLTDCIIYNCGELKPGEPWILHETDETNDVYPRWPDDWDLPEGDKSQIIETAINNIKESGNFFYKAEKYVVSESKYKKALRYINWLHTIDSIKLSPYKKIRAQSLLNLATVKLKQDKNKEAVKVCNELIAMDPDMGKAYYRRAMAYTSLKEFDLALPDFKKALIFYPSNPKILSDLKAMKDLHSYYLDEEKKICAKMFN